ncbi:aspartyl protease family protein [Alteromonas gilva]|uniref:Aspartyl protease family protein n=1 Tax=Alteromonas gilva TaxID=2987522 RepID=A0ABT5L014_9ALTE|nr:aspartyl protease family protein [Alteromonas gilva]MDC8830222.1 aspartyl protease family protein [Alteromonas gilva]
MKLWLLMTLLAVSTGTRALETASQSAEIRYDSRNRPVIATEVNGQGPYYMVVDTGAESSLMMPALAERLKLESFDSGLTITGATGSIAAQAYPVDAFKSKLFDISYVGLLAMPNTGSTEAAGIIGMDLFSNGALIFDLAANKLKTAPSGEVAGHYITIPAIEDDSLLIHVNVKMNGVEIPALIDTGAAASIANLATIKALGWQTTDAHLTDDGAILGATTDTNRIKKATVDTISLGGITMREVPIRFTIDNDGQAPSLILGVDVLNSLIGFAIDFPKQELLIYLPQLTTQAHLASIAPTV